MKYHFAFSFFQGQSEVMLDMPTSPMYIEGSTYSGRCKMWLKRVDFGSLDYDLFVGGLGVATVAIEFDTTAYNRFLLNTGGSVKSNSMSKARFNIPLTNETCVHHQLNIRQRIRGYVSARNSDNSRFAGHPYYQTISVDGGGIETLRQKIDLVARTYAAGGADGGAVDATNTQDSFFYTLRPSRTAGNNNYMGADVADYIERIFAGVGADGLNGEGTMFLDTTATSANADARADVGRSISYHNPVMNDMDCMIIGSPWGNQLKVRMLGQSLRNVLAGSGDENNIECRSRGLFEIVIEPMTNDESVDVSI